MNRFKYNLKRYVFSGRYFVRNALFVMILATIVSIGVVGYSLISSGSEENKEAKKVETETVSRLSVAEPSMIVDVDVDKLDQLITDEQKVEVTAKQETVLTNTRYDMTGKFLCTIDTVNIRSIASEQGEVVGCLYRGATGKVTEAGKTWTKIESGDVTGYVATELILTDAEATEKAEEYKGYIATTLESQVCVRKDADPEAEILYLADQGETLIACEDSTDNGWFNVRLADGTYGYISADLVSVEEDYINAISIEKIHAAQAVMKQITDRAEEEARKAEEAKEEEDRRKAVEEREKELEKAQAELKAAEEEAKKAEAAEEAKKAEEESKKETEKAADKQTAQTTTQESPIDADASDLYLLAAITYCEAGAEPYEGQLAVANVVLNRLRNGGYGKTLADVIYAPYQFTGCKMSTFPNALKTGGSASCLKAAQAALNGENNIGGCKYFRPYKNLNLEKIGNYTIIGTHAFY